MGWNMYLIYFESKKFLQNSINNSYFIFNILNTKKSVGITLGAGTFMKKADSSQAKLCATYTKDNLKIWTAHFI